MPVDYEAMVSTSGYTESMTGTPETSMLPNAGPVIRSIYPFKLVQKVVLTC